MHANTSKEMSAKELRKFGLSTGAIFAGLFGVVIPWIWDLNYQIWPWAVFGILGLLALIAPKSLQIVYRTWMQIGLAISKITTPIILGIVFYLVIMPAGVIMRGFGKDPMDRKFNADAHSYRIEKRGQSTGTLENPY